METAQAFRQRLAILAGLAILASLLVTWPLAGTAEGSHFRSGHASFSWQSAGGNAVDFRIQNSWRWDGYGSGTSRPCQEFDTEGNASSVACTGPDGHPGPGDIIRETLGGTHFMTGDGTRLPSSGALYYLVDSINVERNWLFAFALDPNQLENGVVSTTIRHDYGEPGTYLASFEDCCRIGTAAGLVNHTSAYRVETTVTVGLENNSPFTVMPPIVPCEAGELCQFPVLTNDPDGDPLRFRLATAAESGGLSQPGHGVQGVDDASIDPDTGIYTWDTAGAQFNTPPQPTYYATQVIIEDLDGEGQPMSKVAVDFFIELRETVGDPPAFDDVQDSSEPVRITEAPGSFIEFDVTVCAAESEDDVTLNVINLPEGASMQPSLPETQQGCVTSTFSWQTPNPQPLTHLVVFQATDEHGNTTTVNYIITLEEPAPGGPAPRPQAVETGDQATADQPLVVRVEPTRLGAIEILLRDTESADPQGLTLLGLEAAVTAPDASVLSPLSVIFRLHESLLEGAHPDDVVVFRNGEAVPDCEDATGTARPDPCITERELAGEEFIITVLASQASVWNFGVPETPDLPDPPIADACPAGAVPLFGDVATDGVHTDAIGCAALFDIAQGFADGTYGPAVPVRRDQMASFVVRTLEAAGHPLPVVQHGFVDIDGNVHAEAIGRLAAADIVHGTTATIYSPAELVRRDQMAAFLVRALEWAHGGELAASGGTVFADTAGNTHEGAINVAFEHGLTAGRTADTYGPADPVRRDQMATFLIRLLDRLQ